MSNSHPENNSHNIPVFNSESTSIPMANLQANPTQVIKIRPNYLFSKALGKDLYYVMMSENPNLRQKLKASIITTYRRKYIIITFPFMLVLVIGIVKGFSSGLAWIIPTLVALALIYLGNGYYYSHYLRSVKDKETYLKLNDKFVVNWEKSHGKYSPQSHESTSIPLPPYSNRMSL